MKKCRFCSETIQNEAVKCRFCGEFIDPVVNKRKEPWYSRTSAIVTAFFIAGPFSVILVWLNKNYSLKKKITASVIITVLSVFVICIVYVSVKNILNYYSQINTLLKEF